MSNTHLLSERVKWHDHGPTSKSGQSCKQGRNGKSTVMEINMFWKPKRVIEEY